MAYFPMFIDLENKNCLLIGGNKHILEKIERLLPYGPNIEVVAESFIDGFQKIQGIRITESIFDESMLDGKDIVFGSLDHETNNLIYEQCKKRHIPVNAVDDIDNCDFIFPSLIRRGPLSIGISTSGYSPAAAVVLKEKINEMLPDDFAVIMDYMNDKRDEVMRRFTDCKSRSKVFRMLFSACFEKGRVLSDSEYQEIIDQCINA